MAGIPDLRLAGDRYLSLEGDRHKAEVLAARQDLSFPELVQEYWRLTPEVPVRLAARWAAVAVDGTGRAESWLRNAGSPSPGETVLDVGCGSGALVVAAARHGASVTGVDSALRWLVVAGRCCQEEGVEARLVAADGAVLPFRTGSFDMTVSVEALEHARDQRSFVQSCLLSVRPGGCFWLLTANRFSFGPDPALGLLGLGYLPRRLAVPYVARRKGTRYQAVRPLSAGELRSMIGLRDDIVVGPGPVPEPSSSASGARRWLSEVYELARRVPAAHPLLVKVGPYLQAAGVSAPA